jgi:nucleolin
MLSLSAEGEDATRAALQEVFGECGEVVNIRLPSDRESGELKGIAYIEFGSADAKDKAGELNGSEAAGGYLKVDVNVAPRTPGGGGGFGGGFGGGRGGGFGGRGGGGFGGRGGGRGGDRGE